jgi:phosphoribosylanthranilate isomerase
MYLRTRIKMCGTTSITDACEAARLGVDAIGLIFAEKSPRYITPEKALEITSKLPPFLTKVGVFVNKEKKEIEEIVHYLGLNAVQLHGSEEPKYCSDLASAIPTCSILKAIRVGTHSSQEDFLIFDEAVKGFVVDTYEKGRDGGTGKTFDWKILDKIQLNLPLILAGGLTPDNIQDALRTVKPLAVDVNSGIEMEPGKKDHAKLKKLVEKVREIDSSKLI